MAGVWAGQQKWLCIARLLAFMAGKTLDGIE